MGMSERVRVTHDSLWVGRWRALRTEDTVTVTGPANEPVPSDIAVFLGGIAATPAFGSTRFPLPEAVTS